MSFGKKRFATVLAVGLLASVTWAECPIMLVRQNPDYVSVYMNGKKSLRMPRDISSDEFEQQVIQAFGESAVRYSAYRYESGSNAFIIAPASYGGGACFAWTCDATGETYFFVPAVRTALIIPHYR